MNRAIPEPELPTLPKELRAYDRDLRQKLKTWASAVTSQLNTQSQGVGAALTAGTTLNVTNHIHSVGGTATIQNIVAPAGFTGTVVLLPTALWSTGTGGNIAFATTAVVGKALHMTFDGTKWNPSY